MSKVKQEREEQAHDMSRLPSLHSLVLSAPKTGMDSSVTPRIPELPANVLAYLARNVEGKPWLDHLTLAVLIMRSRNFDPSSIYNSVSLMHSKIKHFFSTEKLGFRVETMETLNSQIDECMCLYLNGVFATDTKLTRTSFYIRYQSLATLSQEWLMSVPPQMRPAYKPLLFASPNYALHKHLLEQKDLAEQQRQRRKADTDALMPIYPDLRSEAHLRWNFLTRLRDAYAKFIKQVGAKANVEFPLRFHYSDAGNRYEFRLHTADSLLRHYQVKSSSPLSMPREPIPELLRVTRIDDNQEAPVKDVLWFIELLKHAVGTRYKSASQEDIQWKKSWGYTGTSFQAKSGGLLYWREASGMRLAQAYAEGVLIPIEELWLGATFGVLAVDLFTTTGIRLNEAMQVSLDRDCFVRLVVPPSPGSEKKEPSVRYSLRLIPKGQKKDEREDNFIGPETKRLLYKVAKTLELHYGLKEHESLPSVPFDHLHRRSHRFNSAPYIFQLNHKHLSGSTISACMRFLIHGMDIRGSDGNMVAVRPHLLRHAFATHAVQVEKIPIDIVGRWLHQKTISVTAYYSQATDSMVADAADRYLTRISSHIDVENEVHRSPAYLKTLYEESVNKTGTLAQVVGGNCASHGLCKAQLACIGCAAKVPDPEKRSQVTHQRNWAEREIVFYRKEGLMPEAKRLEKMVSDANGELREMDMIEAYRMDEERLGTIEVVDDQC